MPFQNDEDSCLSSYLWIFFFSFQMLVGKTGSKMVVLLFYSFPIFNHQILLLSFGLAFNSRGQCSH